MDAACRPPDSDTDWQAIDIFVFSNGQEYSPPRKYHFQADDINLWKATLSFLAKSQYGPYHSTVDLYTIEGRKITDPLQLSNGGTYVAVQPPETFIAAGYEKYLIKASRSWEKRRMRRSETDVECVPDQCTDNNETDDHCDCDRTEETIVVTSTVSSVVNHDVSTIIKPQLLSTPVRVSNSTYPAKQAEKKKTSIQTPIVITKITPTLIPAPNMRNSFNRRRDSLKTTVKTKNPEDRKHSSTVSSSLEASTSNRPLQKKVITPFHKKYTRPDSSVAKVPKGINELNSLSSTKYTTAKLLNSSTGLGNPIQDDQLAKIASLYQNPYQEIPSIYLNSTLQNPYKEITPISVNPTAMQSIIYDPVRQQATTAVDNNSNSKPVEIEEQLNDDITVKGGENDVKLHNTEVLETINETTTQNKETINLLNTPKINDRFDTPKLAPKRLSIKVELPSSSQNKSNFNASNLQETIHNEYAINARKSSETIKVYTDPSSSRNSTVITRAIDDQFISQEIEEELVSPPTVIDKSLNNQYKAVLKKGDVINLKLNIEIESYDASLTKNNENVNHQGVSIIQTDKGSQSTIDDQFIRQNKSLICLITKELKTQHIGDTNRVVVFHRDSCKHCRDRNLTNENQDPNKQFVILLPVEQFQEAEDRCQCKESRPEIQTSIVSSLKPTYSCSSLKTITRPSTDATTQNIYYADSKSTENVITLSKKTVAINKESATNAIGPIKIVQDVDVKTRLVTLSVESVGTGIQTIGKKDNSTQTDWCDVLLEATLLEDGHYTFRLPPLGLLKYHKLS